MILGQPFYCWLQPAADVNAYSNRCCQIPAITGCCQQQDAHSAKIAPELTEVRFFHSKLISR